MVESGYLEDRMPSRVVVTAGASGIGLEIVRAFPDSGAAVYTCDIAPGASEKAATLPGVNWI